MYDETLMILPEILQLGIVIFAIIRSVKCYPKVFLLTSFTKTLVPVGC